jgi:hypothetical protein
MSGRGNRSTKPVRLQTDPPAGGTVLVPSAWATGMEAARALATTPTQVPTFSRQGRRGRLLWLFPKIVDQPRLPWTAPPGN